MLSYLEVENGFIELSKKTDFNFSKEWTELPNRVRIRLLSRGVLQVKPARPGHTDLVLSCGIHGNETAPIEIVSKLISQIVTGAIEPKAELLVILGNPESMLISDRFVSINLNRLFNGAYSDYPKSAENQYELERAAELEAVVRDFYQARTDSKRIHLDLHTAIKPSFHKTFAIRPFQQSRINSQSKLMLKAMGIEAVLQHNKPSTTFSAYSVDQFNAEAYTLELGKVKPFGENDPQDFKAAIASLEQLIQEKSVDSRDENELIEYKVVAEIIKHSNNFKFYVPDDVANFTPYPQGALIAEDDDFNYRVAFQNEAVVFPNIHVPIGQRVAVMVARRDEE